MLEGAIEFGPSATAFERTMTKIKCQWSKVGNENIVVQGMQMVHKGPRLVKGA